MVLYLLVNKFLILKNFLNFLNASVRYDFLKVRFPHVFETLPYLKNNIKNYFKPKYIVTQYRHNVSIVIGVSTMKRQNATYLDKMLDSLFDSMTNDERSQVLVVLLIAEVSKLLLISSN